jgi:peptide/nickel transport system substrate-binding protein
VDEIVYTPVKEGNTRMSALLANNLDFVLDPPVQDIDKLKTDKSVKVYEGRENRIIFLQMDQNRDELKYSSVKGKNPFKDVRVRKAFYQAIDVNAINKTVMRGLSVPTAINLPNPDKAGIPKEMDKRWPYDINASKKLLADAGYPNGFDIQLDCPNNRYINDEKICVAVAGMLAKVRRHGEGERDPARAVLPEGAADGHQLLHAGLGRRHDRRDLHAAAGAPSRNDKGDGDYNWGNYKDEKLDAMIDSAKGDTDASTASRRSTTR